MEARAHLKVDAKMNCKLLLVLMLAAAAVAAASTGSAPAVVPVDSTAVDAGAESADEPMLGLLATSPSRVPEIVLPLWRTGGKMKYDDILKGVKRYHDRDTNYAVHECANKPYVCITGVLEKNSEGTQTFGVSPSSMPFIVLTHADILVVTGH